MFFAHQAKHPHCSPYLYVLDGRFPEPVPGAAEAFGITEDEAQELYDDQDEGEAIELLHALIAKYSATGPRKIDVDMSPAQGEPEEFRHTVDDCTGTAKKYGSGWRCDVCRAIDYGKPAEPLTVNPAQAEQQKIADRLFDRSRNELDAAKALTLFELALQIERGEE
jgi:hypothetical protein